MRPRLVLPLLLAALVLLAALIAPSGGTGALLARPSVELPILLVVLMLGAGLARVAATVALLALVMQKIADLGMSQALGRPFNVVTDLPLLRSAVGVVGGSFGPYAAAATVVAAVLVALCIAGALWWAAGRWRRVGPKLGLGLVAAILLVLLPLMTVRPLNTQYALARVAMAQDTRAALREFRAAALDDPMAEQPGLLAAIDRDVLVVFVESYGRASFDDPFYADTHLPTLRHSQDALAAAGLSMRSGFLTSPTQGGQSWLAHATFGSGMRVGDQAVYQASLASGRQGLFHYAQRAGFRTATVAPAITKPWPEAHVMGFDQVLAAKDLGYQGPPFNWVTMPDQFTLAATDRLLRGKDGPHLFAQVVLISSHAPWVPVPSLVDWEGMGNGSGFAAMANAGESPQQVWRDRDKIRRHYRDALDYSLQVVLDYALRHAADPPLIIMLGDHQAAQGIAGMGGRDVPIHVIGPKALVQPAAAWGFAPGLIPDDGPAIPMQRMRNLILQSYAALP